MPTSKRFEAAAKGAATGLTRLATVAQTFSQALSSEKGSGTGSRLSSRTRARMRPGRRLAFRAALVVLPAVLLLFLPRLSSPALRDASSGDGLQGAAGPGLGAGVFELDLQVAARPVEAADRPFGLPFGEPPGPGSWYISQPYGNTVYAFFERHGLYKSGQGLHMGLDMAAPCGTKVLAIGDGVVLSVDGRGGAPPHNLMIDHSNGFVSFYGHLLERPNLSVGRYVRRGEPVALSGDMYGSCVASPHLHLEVRDQGLGKVYNPVNLIDADWHGILLLGSAPLAFERDMDAPRRWQAIDDQPPITLGGPLLNEFKSPWPGDSR